MRHWVNIEVLNLFILFTCFAIFDRYELCARKAECCLELTARIFEELLHEPVLSIVIVKLSFCYVPYTIYIH